MPGTIVTKEQILRNLSLLEEEVSDYTNLDILGYGKCPFHEEQTASFNIFVGKSGRARFHCFGCEADGDIFDFLLRTQKMRFAAAFERLKTKMGDYSPSCPLKGSAGLHPASATIGDPLYCERDCLRYAALREDYNALLEENEALRQKLNMPPFRPTNEGAYFGPPSTDIPSHGDLP